MGSKLKVGDRVRYAKEDGPWSEWQIHKGAEGVVKNVIRDLVDVQFDSTDCIYADELELVESTDPKTAFLSELKGLLEKYDAGIYVDFNQSDEIYTTTIAVGEDSVKYNYTDGIDCDNIMDYGKE